MDKERLPLRILVVEDSLTIRRHLVEVLESDAGLRVVGEAADGTEAMRLCEQLRPDVVTMDMMLGKTSGLAATEYIMAHCPTPILIVSASTNRRELFKTYDALAAGAVDVLEKPTAEVSDEAWRRELLSRVHMASRIKVITHLRAKLRPHVRPEPTAALLLPGQEWQGPPRLVAIGASTGGPAALVEILRQLPRDFHLPILVVLHLSGPFGFVFAEWLAGQISIPVSCATDGTPLPPLGKPSVLMAPPDRHLVLRGGRLRLTDDPERHGCRPSVDVLFESLVSEPGSRTLACLLTGMGRDGAAGLYAIRQAGGATLVQDEATSVVFGMPGEAVRLGAATRVLPLSRIADAICSLAGSKACGEPRL